MKVKCPHCAKSIGGPATEGGFRLRLGIMIVDPDAGTIHGPCTHCKQDVVVAYESTMNKALLHDNRNLKPGILVRKG